MTVPACYAMKQQVITCITMTSAGLGLVPCAGAQILCVYIWRGLSESRHSVASGNCAGEVGLKVLGTSKMV